MGLARHKCPYSDMYDIRLHNAIACDLELVKAFTRLEIAYQVMKVPIAGLDLDLVQLWLKAFFHKNHILSRL